MFAATDKAVMASIAEAKIQSFYRRRESSDETEHETVKRNRIARNQIQIMGEGAQQEHDGRNALIDFLFENCSGKLDELQQLLRAARFHDLALSIAARRGLR